MARHKCEDLLTFIPSSKYDELSSTWLASSPISSWLSRNNLLHNLLHKWWKRGRKQLPKRQRARRREDEEEEEKSGSPSLISVRGENKKKKEEEMWAWNDSRWLWFRFFERGQLLHHHLPGFYSFLILSCEMWSRNWFKWAGISCD